MPQNSSGDRNSPRKRFGPPRAGVPRKPARPVKGAPPRKAAPAPKAEAGEPRGAERIAKVMARAGACSRRDAESWIGEGRVAVNGALLRDPAVNVGENDTITIDGTPLPQRAKTRLFRFHKPRGLVTTEHDPEGRPTIFDHLREHWPDGPRTVSVGRLDINTEGLMLLTNDGGLARVLELPATGWVRRYRVRVNGETDQAALDTLHRGITIDGVSYAGIEATFDRVQGANCWLTMALREGKNREIKRVLEHLGLVVTRLIRLSFGPFQLGELAEGAVEEVRTKVLRDQLGPSLAKAAGADFTSPADEEPASPPVSAERHRPERPPRQERPSRQERSPRQERPSGQDRPPRQDRPSGQERPPRQERSPRPERSPRQERPSGQDRPPRQERPSGQERSPRQERGPSDTTRPRRDSRGAAAPRHEPPAPAKVKPPSRVRKHVSVLRRQEAVGQDGPRKRIERSETSDRSGRVVSVERVVPVAAKPERAQTRNGRRFKSLREGLDDSSARAPRGGKPRAESRRSEASEVRNRSGAQRKSAKPGAGKPAAGALSREPHKAARRDNATRHETGDAVRSARSGQRPGRPEGGERPLRRFERPKGAAEGQASGRAEKQAHTKKRVDGSHRGASPHQTPAGRPAPGGGHAQKPGGGPARKGTRPGPPRGKT